MLTKLLESITENSSKNDIRHVIGQLNVEMCFLISKKNVKGLNVLRQFLLSYLSINAQELCKFDIGKRYVADLSRLVGYIEGGLDEIKSQKK